MSKPEEGHIRRVKHAGGENVLRGRSSRQAEGKHTEKETYWGNEAVGGLRDKSSRGYDFTQ